MTALGREKKVPLADREVTVRELTTAEIRAWLRDVDASPDKEGDVDLVGNMLFDDATFDDLMRMSDATAELLEQAPPSQIRALRDACKEVNADFFAMRLRIAEVGRRALEGGRNSSSEPSVR